MQSRKSLWTYLFGSLFLFFGISILLDNLHIIYFKEIWRIYWPILIILIGIIIILRRSEKEEPAKTKNEDKNIENEPIENEEKQSTNTVDPEVFGSSYSGEFNQSNVFGNIRFSSNTKEYPGGSINNVFGDISVDLKNIDFEDGVRTLHINGVFGSIKVFLPPDIPVKFTGSTIAGSAKFLSEKKDGLLVNLTTASPGFDTATKKLKINISIVFGDISIE